MNDIAYPSGEWVGYYTYHDKDAVLLPMHLTLQFALGCVQGAGIDKIGQFVVQGTYDDAASQTRWVKRYVGKHDVQYEGTYQDGEIRGSWSLTEMSQGRPASLHGKFRLWPLPAGESDEPLQSVLEREIRRRLAEDPEPRELRSLRSVLDVRRKR